MLELLKFEFVKLRKSKLNILIFLILLIIPFIVTYQTLNSNQFGNKDYRSPENIDLIYDGKTYSGLSAIQKIDSQHHSLRGEMNEEWEKRVSDEAAQKKINLEKQMSVDKNAMRSLYGENWEVLYHKYLNKTLKVKDVKDVYQGEDAQFQFEGMDDQDIYEMQILYEPSHELEMNSLSLMYPDIDYLHITSPSQNFITKEKIEFYAITRKQVSYKRELQISGKMDSFDYANRDMHQIHYLNKKYANRPTQYDSTVAMSYFLMIFQEMKYILPIVFLFLGFMLLTIYNQEYEHRTDQILRGVKVNTKRQARAKNLMVLLCSAGITLYYLIVFLLLLQVTIGFHDWNVVMQGIFNRFSLTNNMYTVKEVLLTVSVLFVCSGITLGSFISLYSSKCKRKSTAILLYLVTIAILVLPQLFFLSMMEGGFERIGVFLPGTSYFPENLFTLSVQQAYSTLPNWNYLTIGGFVIHSRWAIGLESFLITGVCFYIARRYYQKREISNS